MFRHLVQEAGKEDFYEVDSAGTGAWHIGESPDARMREVAARRGFIYDGNARQLDPEDFQRFDTMVVMDRENFKNVTRLARSPEDRAKVVMMRAFDPQGSTEDAVPDPYYGGLDGFENVYDIVERSCRGLFEELEASRK
jgi:protein-tyrosine phosphatase